MIRLARGLFCLAVAAAGVARADVPPNPTAKRTPPSPDSPTPTDTGSTKQEPEEEKSRLPTAIAIGAVIAVYASMRTRRKQISAEPAPTDHQT